MASDTDSDTANGDGEQIIKLTGDESITWLNVDGWDDDTTPVGWGGELSFHESDEIYIYVPDSVELELVEEAARED